MPARADSPLFPAPVRRALAPDFDAGDVAALDRAFDALLARAPGSGTELVDWLADADELESAVDALEARRRIAATRDTTDLAARRAHLDVAQRIRPAVRRRLHELDGAFLASRHRGQLDAATWGTFARSRANRAALHRPELVQLAAREAELVLRHDELTGGLLVPFAGGRHTPQAMARFLDSGDREVRRAAFRALSAARLSLAPRLEVVFDQLLALRREMAAAAGLGDYRTFRFRELERFEYAPTDCERFHDAIESRIVPAAVAWRERRRQRLGVPRLAPWDLVVDPDGGAPLRPFADEGELLDLGQTLFERVCPEFGAQFAHLRELSLLDLMNRPGKAPGGYQATLQDTRLPFIFANAVGLHGDVRTLLHEGGHAFHALAARGLPQIRMRRPPLEFAEVASMSLELLGSEHYEAVYGAAEARRARRVQFEHVLELLPWVATVDAFQHWLYGYPEHSREERAAHWLSLRRRFEPDVDWSQDEEWRAAEWTRQLHLFRAPFYYVEYGIAQVGALQVWLNARRHGTSALTAFRGALALGGSRPLPELFTAARACFDFGPVMLGTLGAAVLDVLAET